MMNVKSIIQLIALLGLRNRHLAYDEKIISELNEHLRIIESGLKFADERINKLESAIKLEIGYFEQWVTQDPDCDAARVVLDRLKTIVSS